LRFRAGRRASVCSSAGKLPCSGSTSKSWRSASPSIRRIVRRMPHVVEDESRRLLLLPGDPLHPDPAGDEPPVETRFVLVDQRWRAERART